MSRDLVRACAIGRAATLRRGPGPAGVRADGLFSPAGWDTPTWAQATCGGRVATCGANACGGRPAATSVSRPASAHGLRKSGLADVDFLRRIVSVQRQVQGETAATSAAVAPKYGSERVVYVPTELLAILSEHVGRLGIQPGEWLLPNGDRPFNRNSAGEQWRRIRAAAGLTDFTLHDLRHFYASGLIASGCDVVTVQRALGHSSATITLGVYSHLWPTVEDRTRAAAGDLMAAALRTSADYPRTKSSR